MYRLKKFLCEDIVQPGRSSKSAAAGHHSKDRQQQQQQQARINSISDRERRSLNYMLCVLAAFSLPSSDDQVSAAAAACPTGVNKEAVDFVTQHFESLSRTSSSSQRSRHSSMCSTTKSIYDSDCSVCRGQQSVHVSFDESRMLHSSCSQCFACFDVCCFSFQPVGIGDAALKCPMCHSVCLKLETSSAAAATEFKWLVRDDFDGMCPFCSVVMKFH